MLAAYSDHAILNLHMERPTVLLLFGGESSEHDVSVSSARNVYAAIDDATYNVVLGYIDNEGKWWLLDTLEGEINTDETPQLAPLLGGGGFITIPHNNTVKPDVILAILHGSNGEDGSVQGLAQLLHIPIVGCDMTASAICMDKVATKEILEARGIKVVPYEIHRTDTPVPDFNHLSMRLGSPMFVKPSRSGSSVGVSKVFSEDELTQAVIDAHKHDETVLIERGITARELEVAILGNPPSHEISVVGEIIPDADFYTYEAKYATTSSSKVIIPAEIDETQHAKVRALAGEVYSLLGCKGFARIDFFLAEDGTIYVNEVNTIPGFTNISMYPKLWREAGMSYSQIIERLISLAMGSTIKSEIMEE
jgi:D-alanine-D-alanine ligase